MDPSRPPLDDEEALRAWWEQLDERGDGSDPAYLDEPPGEGHRASDPPPSAAPPVREAPPSSSPPRQPLLADLKPDDLARAFIVGEILGPPPSRRGRR